MNPPRIAYICADPGVPVFGRKGCSIHVQEILRALRRQGARVDLFAVRFDSAPPEDLREVRIHALPCPNGRDLAGRERACQQANTTLADMLRDNGPFDFVYERFSLWSFAGMLSARASGVPGLLEVNAPLIEEQAAHRGLADRAAAERIAQRALNDASALLAVSDAVAQWLRARGVRPDAVHVLPNGVDPRRFSADAAPAWHWGGETPAFTVGFVGSLKPWHGVPVLIQAFARLHNEAPNARLLIVGDGPDRGALEEHVRELHLESFVRFTGAVAPEQIPGLLAAMDVAVAPYPPLAGFYFSPLKVYEYMAAGRAVIGSRLGQLAQLIRHGDNGLLCEPGDAADLAAQLGRLRGDAAMRARLGAAARKTILEHHTWDHVASRIQALARSCRGSDPACGASSQVAFQFPPSSRPTPLSP
jgi:glycosyltransferase involved in cell wall biosynthesis